MLKAGDTFLSPSSTSSSAKEHLYIVLNDPEPKTHLAICVNVTTVQSFSDHTVELEVGDHPYVKHKSVVNYGDAGKLDMKTLQELIDKNTGEFVCKMHKPCKPDILDRIRQGAIQSKRTPKDIKKECEERWGKKFGEKAKK